MLVNTGRAAEGVAQFQAILKADPSNNMARVNIGFAHLQKAELDQAEADFREVIRRDPELGDRALRSRRGAEAKGPARCGQSRAGRALASIRACRRRTTRWASSTGRTGISTKPRKKCRPPLSIRPDYADAHFMLGTALKQKGDLDGGRVGLARRHPPRSR